MSKEPKAKASPNAQSACLLSTIALRPFNIRLIPVEEWLFNYWEKVPRLESCADIGILIDGKKCVQTRVKTAFNYKKFLKQIFSILRFVLIISIDSTFLFDWTRTMYYIYPTRAIVFQYKVHFQHFLIFFQMRARRTFLHGYLIYQWNRFIWSVKA